MMTTTRLMEYYIFDEVSPNRDAPYLDLPDEIDLIDSIMGKQPDFDELPIKIPAKIKEDEEVVYTDIINPGVPLFSDKMKSALDQFGVTNIDYYPVQLIDSETKEALCEYWLAIVKSILSSHLQIQPKKLANCPYTAIESLKKVSLASILQLKS